MSLTNTSTPLVEALHLHTLGLSIIPVHLPGMPLPLGGEKDQVGKVPLVAWKTYQGRHPTEDEIRTWWTKWPEANVAVVTGRISGVIVLDVDGAEGRESLTRRAPVPVTWRSRTGRVDGGEQLWFRHSGDSVRNFAKRLPGFDLRGDGGYVVVPPSRHRSGRQYEWIISPDEAELADLPDWLLALIESPPQTDDGQKDNQTRDWLKLLQGAPKGQRHATATQIAGHFLSLGRPREEVEALLIGYGAQCTPPHDPEDLRRIVRDLSAKDTAKGAADEEPEVDAKPLALPEVVWRGAFADYRAAMQGTSEAPDSAHFSAFWAMAAVLLRRRVSIHYAYTHYANVLLVNYGATGESKTSASRQTIRLLPQDNRVKLLRGVGSSEALGDWMKQPEDAPQVSHLIFLEELSTLLIRGGWEGSTLLSFLTETFDAPDLYEVPFRKNPIKVTEPTPTLLAGTTPEWFWKSMREIDFHGGFGNRLFFLTGTPKPPIPMPAKPDAKRLQRVQDALVGLDETPSGEMTLTPQALELWTEFYCAWKQTVPTFDPLTAAATKRIPAYALKLALVYAALERTAPAITGDQIAAAVRVAQYGVWCAQRLIQGRRQFSHQGRCEEAICRVLGNENLPAWRIHQRVGGRFTAEDVARAIRGLIAAGAILELEKTKRGEPVYGLRRRMR